MRLTGPRGNFGLEIRSFGDIARIAEETDNPDFVQRVFQHWCRWVQRHEIRISQGMRNYIVWNRRRPDPTSRHSLFSDGRSSGLARLARERLARRPPP